MLRDRYMRIIFIPILGFSIPFASGVITYKNYSIPVLVLVHVYFSIISFFIWVGCSLVHSKLRPLVSDINNPIKSILIVLLASGIYGACVSGFLILLWYEFSQEFFLWNNALTFIICSVLAIVILELVYEIMFLGLERKKDTTLVKQMGTDLTQAELQALNQETDHHFIFNSLSAMNHLILEDPTQARLFNTNLSQVYKYFLLNKKKELIPLTMEIAFMESYFFLLRIRYGNMIRLCSSIRDTHHLMIPPCALQLLVENAIKHNDFSEQNPLQILLEKNGNYISVSNNVCPKAYPDYSTQIGLKNLGLRFRLISKKEIVIENRGSIYTVKLPLIEQPEIYSHD